MIESGLTPDLFNEIMMMASNLEGKSRYETISRAMQIFKTGNLNSAILTDQWNMLTKNGTEAVSSESTQELIDKYSNKPPPADSPELDAARQIEEIKNILTETGHSYWDDQMKKLPEELAKAIQGLKESKEKNEPFVPADTTGMTPFEAEKIRRQEWQDALKTGGKDRTTQTFIALEKAQMEALTQNSPIDPIDNETKRNSEIEKMLIKTGISWDKDKATFFTADGFPLTKNDDEKAHDRFTAYRDSGKPQAVENFYKAVSILESLTPEQRKAANENDYINRAIPDVMTDTTGQQLLRAIEGLRDDLNNVTVTTEEIP